MPRDPAGTRTRIEAAGRFTVGVADPGGRLPQVAAAYIERVAARVHARPRLMAGSQEQLFLALDRGDVDLIVGEIATDTPWVTRAAIIDPPLRPGEEVKLAAAARNGENDWIALLEGAARDAAGQ